MKLPDLSKRHMRALAIVLLFSTFIVTLFTQYDSREVLVLIGIVIGYLFRSSGPGDDE